jgi:signal transduction histidine kinase
VDASVALAEVSEVVAPLARASGDRLTVSVEPGVGVISADPKLLTQCLLNLAGNAAKFTRNGHIELRARRLLLDGRSCVALDVVDNGIGIEAEALSRLFAPFQQANASIARAYGGAGLGLSITRKLARSMGGEVLVRSAPGVGSTFTLVLPVGAESSSMLAA